MPFWIEGWVEIRRGPAEASDWQGVLRLNPLIDVGDAISERLFGLSRAYRSGCATVEALAPNRGVPSDASGEARIEIDAGRAFIESGELGGHTHATWREIADVVLDERFPAESDWRLVLRFMAELARDPRLDPDRVRVIAWFNW